MTETGLDSGRSGSHYSYFLARLRESVDVTSDTLILTFSHREKELSETFYRFHTLQY